MKGSFWEAKVIKAEDVVFEDRIGQDPVKTRVARIVRQPQSNGVGVGITMGVVVLMGTTAMFGLAIYAAE